MQMNQYFPNVKSRCEVVDGILVYRITSPVDDDLGKELDEAGRAYLEGGDADRVLIDLRGSSTFSIRARIRWVSFLRLPQIKKTAMFGGSRLVRTIAHVMMTLAKSNNVRHFSDEQDALRWLREA